MLGCDIEAAVDLQLVERELDGLHAVEHGLVAFSDPDGFEPIVREEMFEHGAVADIFIGLGGGEVGLGWEGDFAHDSSGVLGGRGFDFVLPLGELCLDMAGGDAASRGAGVFAKVARLIEQDVEDGDGGGAFRWRERWQRHGDLMRVINERIQSVQINNCLLLI